MNHQDTEHTDETGREEVNVVQPKAKKSTNQPLIIALSISGVVIVALLFGIAGLALTTFGNGQADTASVSSRGQFGGGNSSENGSSDQFPGRGEGPGGMMDGGEGGSASSGTRLNGVVISVDGDTFVVAGNGKRTTVKKSDATTFRSSTETIAVDDTVMVMGTTGSDGVMSATSIGVMGAAN